ncbi:MAG: hypothetical protein MJ091_04565 [Clostridia bacterium]|nr:hypothetical protein [Clostridia bacterium]
MDKNLHAGHRERVRKEFLENGYDDAVPAHKLLEHLLFYAIPRCDTNEIAHRLIDKFGDLSGVIDAPVSEIVKVEGVGENAATLIKLILPVARRYNVEKTSGKINFPSLSLADDYIQKQYLGFTTERLGILGLNSVGDKTVFKFLSEGDISTVGVSVRDIVKAAIDSNSTAVILCHNHPSNNCLPSSADIEITKNVFTALKQIGICLADHVIVGVNDYVSLYQSQKYHYLFEDSLY